MKKRSIRKSTRGRVSSRADMCQGSTPTWAGAHVRFHEQVPRMLPPLCERGQRIHCALYELGAEAVLGLKQGRQPGNGARVAG
eukprot:1186222-Prorocentrum_minimum.AAC.3